jgi:hypothetical protein
VNIEGGSFRTRHYMPAWALAALRLSSAARVKPTRVCDPLFDTWGALVVERAH